MKKNCVHFNQLPVIRCECGAEILLIQQVDLMSKAINSHVEEHRAKISDPIKANAMAKRIEDHLIKQVFEKIQMQQWST